MAFADLSHGTRVELRALPSTHASLHGAQGTIRPKEHEHGEGCQWMQFDEPVKHYTHGQMTGCWVARRWLHILGHEDD